MTILRDLKAKQEALGIVSDYVFANPDGSWINKETYAQRLRRMCRKLGYDITNNHAFRMSLNSNVFIPLGLPATERSYLLGHSVEVNERHYSFMRTERLDHIKAALNNQVTQHTRRNLIRFEDVKNSQIL